MPASSHTRAASSTIAIQRLDLDVEVRSSTTRDRFVWCNRCTTARRSSMRSCCQLHTKTDVAFTSFTIGSSRRRQDSRFVEHALANATQPTASRALSNTIVCLTASRGESRKGRAGGPTGPKQSGSSTRGGRKTLAFSRACSGRQIDGAFPVAFGTTLRKDL